jgi:hypothetical protein
MKRYQNKKVSKEFVVLVEVRCDKCNQLLFEDDNSEHTKNKSDLLKTSESLSKLLPAQFKYEGQFGNKFDDQDWFAELCEKCAIEVFDFINSGPGQGVEIENPFGTGYVDWDRLEHYHHPPYDLSKEQYVGTDSCCYHPELGILELTEDGLKCLKPGCPTFEPVIHKKDLREKPRSN